MEEGLGKDEPFPLESFISTKGKQLSILEIILPLIISDGFNQKQLHNERGEC
jgi:hypothetical protein